MLSPYDIIFAHVVLPDSMSERRRVLRAMLAIVTPEHEAFKNVSRQLAALDKLELLQKELPLKFSTPAKPSSVEGDGE